MEHLPEQFIPFPAERRQQIEAREESKSREIYNPHHPHNKPTPGQAQGNKANPRHPSNRMAAQNMTVNGTSFNGPTAAPTQQSAPDALAQHYQPQHEAPMAAHIPPPSSHHQVSLDVPVTPNSQIEALSMALPSMFFYYGFKEVYIKPFKGANFSKLNRAREEESLLHVVEAVSSVLWTPNVPEGLAFHLTLPDFYATLYWLRLHSFLKHGFTHTTMCRSKIHHDWVANGRPMEDGSVSTVLKDTLTHAETITKATLVTKELKAPIDTSLYPLDDPNIELVVATMKEVLEITMNDNIDRFNARIAASIQPRGQRLPLVERLYLVDELSADDIATIRRFETDSSDYGVDEKIKWQCKTCGHLHTDEIQLEAHSFFPSAA